MGTKIIKKIYIYTIYANLFFCSLCYSILKRLVHQAYSIYTPYYKDYRHKPLDNYKYLDNYLTHSIDRSHAGNTHRTAVLDEPVQSQDRNEPLHYVRTT